ncbi:MAG: hypothetical protein ACRC42_01985 [Mycoplasma sp.]
MFFNSFSFQRYGKALSKVIGAVMPEYDRGGDSLFGDIEDSAKWCLEMQ